MAKYELTDGDVAILRRIWNWIQRSNAQTPGSVNTPYGMSVAPGAAQRRATRTSAAGGFILAKVTDVTTLGTGKYKAKRLNGKPTIAADGTAFTTLEAAGMTLAAEDDLLVVNRGDAAHDLALNQEIVCFDTGAKAGSLTVCFTDSYRAAC